MEKKKDLFENKSKTWDTESGSAQSAKGIADLIVKNIKLNDSMEIMDFGAGTGLLSYFVAPYVQKIIAVDNSPAMLLEFKSKTFPIETEVLEKDLSVEEIDRKVDGVISSMTLHHLEDTRALFSKFYAMLNDGGFIALADLDTEDGSFHSDNTGVFHYGFDRDSLQSIAEEAGFKEVRFDLASTINKPHGTFTVFLLTAVKS
ncbi:MAG TPA: class I SAM-dependent methyltransferase [Sulfurovum sp.]|nr:class I SAM-dependent methyltransferase [Sulfurovum sp.]